MKKHEELVYKHASDCALNNEPAMPAGNCSCDVAITLLDEAILFLEQGENSTFRDKFALIEEMKFCFYGNHRR